MRGGQTDASVVVASPTLRALPILPTAGSAIVMSEKFWEPTRQRIRPGGFVVTNSDLIGEGFPHDGLTVRGVPAQRLAADAGAPLGACLVLLGAFCTMTGISSADSLVAAMRQLVPAYRAQHLAGNESAIRAGCDAVETNSFPLWAIHGQDRVDA